ncbi:MAG: bifunctional adenosylcobinamide kinase/adenosylcobinamide-phosphate guanylyltransferase, partial [Muribaculaceae bacterium]|nr:bifunctional adenosylcobinamide kinase/adenosylcobinamide-phosphate guanylyltransferase [Muribaculaceae bacterium]
KFTDLQGMINQYVSSIADEVYMVVSGIPMKIKSQS